MCCAVGLYQPAIDVWSSVEWCWKSAKAEWFWVILSLCPVTWEESVNLDLWLFGWPSYGLSGCQVMVCFFLGKNLWMYCCPFLVIFADSSKRNSVFFRNRRLEPNLDLRRSSSGWWNTCLSLTHVSYCWAYRASILSSYSDWTMWAGHFFPDAVEPCCGRSSHAWVVRSHISIIALWTHCRACAWLNSWGWEERSVHTSIATCHSIERYPRRVSTLPIEIWDHFTALRMTLFWISELWGAKHILKSLGCLWCRNFRRSPNIVATARPALILWRCEIAIDSLCTHTTTFKS